MIKIIPGFNETVVLPIKADEIFMLLEEATSDKPFIQSNEKTLLFNGWIKEDRFRISLRVHRANNYIPLVIGQIESTRSGSILLVDYKLFPTTRFLLLFWTIVLLFGSIFATYQTDNLLYLIGGVFFITLIYSIVRSNFMLQLKPTREALHRLFL